MKIKISFLLSVVLLGVGYSVAFAADPTIVSVSPTTALMGSTVSLTGTNLDTKPDLHVGIFSTGGTQSWIKPDAITATGLTFTMPTGLIEGSASVCLEWGTPSSCLQVPTVSITVKDVAPTLTSLSAASVRVGDTLTLTGDAFDSGTIIDFSDSGGVFRGYVGVTINPPLPTAWDVPIKFRQTLSVKVPFGIVGQVNVRARKMYSGLTSALLPVTVTPLAPVLQRICSTKWCDYTPSDVFSASDYAYVMSDMTDRATQVFVDNTLLGTFSGECPTNDGSNCVSIPRGLSKGTHSMYMKETYSGLTSNSLSFQVIDTPLLFSNQSFSHISLGGVYWLSGTGFNQSSVVYMDGLDATVTKAGYGYFPGNKSMPYTVPSGLGVGTHTLQVVQKDTGVKSNSITITVDPATSTTPPTPLTTAPSGTPSASATTGTSGATGTATTLSAPDAGTLSSDSGSFTTSPTTSVPASTRAVIQQQILLLITQLLQLVQQAIEQGLISQSQANSVLGSLPTIH